MAGKEISKCSEMPTTVKGKPGRTADSDWRVGVGMVVNGGEMPAGDVRG